MPADPTSSGQTPTKPKTTQAPTPKTTQIEGRY